MEKHMLITDALPRDHSKRSSPPENARKASRKYAG
jgi:hypothetical protein